MNDGFKMNLGFGGVKGTLHDRLHGIHFIECNSLVKYFI